MFFKMFCIYNDLQIHFQQKSDYHPRLHIQYYFSAGRRLK